MLSSSRANASSSRAISHQHLSPSGRPHTKHHSSIHILHSRQQQQHKQQHCGCLPRISEFILTECPVKGIDGTFREQPAKPGTELQDSAVLQMHEEALLVPGQRQLMYVHEQQLERIIADQGRAVLACLQNPPPADSATTNGINGSDSNMLFTTTPKLLSPARGSWAVSARVGGVQRLPGSSRALVRLLVTDRVAVQALSAASAHLALARSAQLRDRWVYFVRTAALDMHLAAAGSNGDGSNGNGGSGRDVLNAVQQVQDAATELLQLLQQMQSTVQQVVDQADADVGGDTDASANNTNSSSLQQALLQHEAAEELAELLTWCEMQGEELVGSNDPQQQQQLFGADELLPADSLLMERAWRLSFAPFAVKGLAAALGVDVSTGSSRAVSSSSSSEVLEVMDLGLRLEAAFELGQALRQKLSARLSLEQLSQQ